MRIPVAEELRELLNWIKLAIVEDENEIQNQVFLFTSGALI
jgi:hypothetical protein